MENQQESKVKAVKITDMDWDHMRDVKGILRCCVKEL